jgi:hypothetical protein
MSEQQPVESPARETPTARRETPQRPPKRVRPWVGAAAVGAAALFAAVVVVVVLATGSAHSVAPPTHPVVPTGPRTVVTVPPSRPASSDALAALSSYWQSIGRHDFAAAYALVAPGAIPQSQAQWVRIEQQTDVQSVRFTGETTNSTGTEATVRISSLVTHDLRFGCRNWTGTYQMINQAGHWLISRADITPASCQAG